MFFQCLVPNIALECPSSPYWFITHVESDRVKVLKKGRQGRTGNNWSPHSGFSSGAFNQDAAEEIQRLSYVRLKVNWLCQFCDYCLFIYYLKYSEQNMMMFSVFSKEKNLPKKLAQKKQ